MGSNTTQNLIERLQFGFLKRLPIQRQTESAECGLACISMIANYFGYRTDIATLRSRFSISQRGATLPQLIEIIGQMNMASRPLRLELDEIGDLQTPCILHWKMDHFVVLKKVTRRGVVVHDPAKGERTYSLEQTSDMFTGVALELRPTPQFSPKIERRKVSLKQLLGRVTGLKRSLFQIIVLAIILEGFTMLAPLLNQLVVDQAISTADVNLLIALGIGFAGIKIITTLIDLLRSWAILVLSATLNVQWLANLFSHLVKLPIGYFEKRHMGDVVSRFNSIHSIQGTLTSGFIGGILDGLLALCTAVMMMIYSPQLATITIAALFAYIGLRGGLYSGLMSATESEVNADARQQSIFLETIRGIQSVRLFGKERERTTIWLNAIVEKKNANLRTQRLTITFQSGNKLVFGLENVAIICIGGKLAMNNVFSVGMLFAFISYKDQFSQRLTSLIDKYFEFRMLRYQIERMADIALTPPETTAMDSTHSVEQMAASLQVKNVSFAYSAGEKPILQNVSFNVFPGEAVAIIGPSGCGKSTLLKLLLGIHSPSRGEICFGGVPLRHVGIPAYRTAIGVVMQEDMLFAGSISENISFFSPQADQAWIEECARMAAMHNEIVAMPMGYHTLIGDVGTTLSGGQKQRVLLARALYRKPRILFMDEATSHLDLANEKLVNAVIQKLAITRIIIAHRPETIASADRVINLAAPSKGPTLQYGPKTTGFKAN